MVSSVRGRYGHLGKKPGGYAGYEDTVRKFSKDRKSILSLEKVKVLIFNKASQSKREVWLWKGREIEEVGIFKYLGFTFNRVCSYFDHKKELERKAVMASKKSWGLEERKCREDFRRRKM